VKIVSRCPGCRKRHYRVVDPAVTWVMCDKCNTPISMRPQASDTPERKRRAIETLGQ
jgi:hypothetical protein